MCLYKYSHYTILCFLLYNLIITWLFFLSVSGQRGFGDSGTDFHEYERQTSSRAGRAPALMLSNFGNLDTLRPRCELSTYARFYIFSNGYSFLLSHFWSLMVI